MKRLIVVADNSLIVGAIRTGLRDSRELKLLGYINPSNASARMIADAGAEVVLVDEADDSKQAIALIRRIKEEHDHITVIVLTVQMDAEWLPHALEAGASAVISKTVHPGALSTLLEESLNEHIVHAPADLTGENAAHGTVATEHSSLTERELEILQLVASGATNGEIARRLWITEQTVKFHVSNIYRKLDVTNRTEACHYAHVNHLGFAPSGSGGLARPAAINSLNRDPVAGEDSEAGLGEGRLDGSGRTDAGAG